MSSWRGILWLGTDEPLFDDVLTLFHNVWRSEQTDLEKNEMAI